MQDDFDDGMDLPEDDVVEEEVTVTDVEYTVPDDLDLEPAAGASMGRMSGGARVRPPMPRPAAKAAPKPSAGAKKKAAPKKKKAAPKKAKPAKKKAAAKKKTAPRKAKRGAAKKRKAGAKK